MFKYRASIVLILAALVLVGPADAGPVVVEIAGKTYDRYQLLDVMEANDFELPDQAVQKIKQDAVIKSLGKSEGELYQQAFGVSLKKDRARAEAQDLPIVSKRAATRLYMFEIWLNEKARNVPVRYLDMAAYWKLVQSTEGYQVRAEAGQEPSSDEIAYTFAELSLPSQQVLASRENKPFLKGSEFNAYVRENYNAIHAMVKRHQSLAKAQNGLIKKIAGEKIAVETTPLEASELSDVDVERSVHAFVEQNFLEEPLELTGTDYLSPSDMLQDLYLKYTRKHEAELDQLRAAISGNKEDKGQSAAQRKHLQKERLGRLKARLSRGLDDDQVYAWMQQRQFRSTLQQARFALANEKYEKHLEASLSQHQVVLNPVK